MRYGAHCYIFTTGWNDDQLRIMDRLKALGGEILEIAVGDDVVFDPARTRRHAESLGMETVDAFLHLIDEDDLKTGGIFFSMSEDNLWRVLAEPYVSLGSDGSMRAPWGPLSTDHPHPRAYGSHSRFLRWALDGKVVPLPEAVYKMTGLPAEQFNLREQAIGRASVASGDWQAYQ